MALSEMHQRQRRKNYILLAVLVGMVALFFTLTTVKLREQATQEAEAAAMAGTAE
jgi:hypothetical protein